MPFPLPLDLRTDPPKSGSPARRHASLFFGRLASLAVLAIAIAGSMGGCHKSLDNELRPTTHGAPLPLVETPSPNITVDELNHHIAALTDPSTAGRLAGSPGERTAADYIARAMAAIGLEPAGDAKGFLHNFEFAAGVSLGRDNAMTISDADDGSSPESRLPDTEWRPLAFSGEGEFDSACLVFVGHGLVVPLDRSGAMLIDAYRDIDVQDCWVMILRDLPSAIDPDAAPHHRQFAGLRYKAMQARDRGAIGVLFVSGPLSHFRNDVVPLRFDAALAGTQIAVLSVSDAVAESIMSRSGQTLALLHEAADARLEFEPIPLSGVRLSARVDLETEIATGTNVIGRLATGPQPTAEQVVIGAHFDHLGTGLEASSLATADEAGQIHAGADDNASGVAVVLEIAGALADAQRQGRLEARRDILFAAWSGEELGLIGSSRWVGEQISPHAAGDGPVAYLNFDMVGRMRDELIVQGIGSSLDWDALLDAALRTQPSASLFTAEVPSEGAVADSGNTHPIAIASQHRSEGPPGPPWTLRRRNDSLLPTDATSFYTRGVPILNSFTGAHPEYHTPRDTLDRLELPAMQAIADLFAEVATGLARTPTPPGYNRQQVGPTKPMRTGFSVYLGTIPDYARSDVQGAPLSGVSAGGPAERAGLRAGDVIVEVAGRKIENLYDYTYALGTLRAGVPARITLLRGTERLNLEVVPESRN